MRCSSNLALHILRQHAARMNPVQHGLQANALLCVLPHLLKPDTLLPANVHSFSRALPYSVQAVEPRLKRAELFNAHPKSLFFHRDTDEPRPEVATSRFRQALLTISGFYSKESQLLRGSKNLYQATVQQAADPRLYEVFQLERKFASEYNMLCLHIWMLLVRLRSEGKDGKALAQMVYESFQENVEARVRAEGVKVRLNKWLNELEQMFYGMSFAFDKSLSGDEDITGALLRNFYNDDKSKQRPADVLARYTTRELACLAKTESEHVLSGQIKFSKDFMKQ